ncbi:MAG: NAD(P)/FAD-dependent oxidoreductase [Pseudomonadales bacterium]|nr:NAD(P)/FAD-dependent oxidoreductase [Pseudomonadales bacterium]
MSDSGVKVLDAVVVGTGMAGLYMIKRLNDRGLNIQAIEAGSGVGGAWYWNRYPGCRADLPIIEYSYSFSKELEQEWDWSEVMAGQPEIERYLNHTADRFDLRKHIKFDTKVTDAIYNEDSNTWTVKTDQGDTYTCKYCIMATGCLNEPNYPGFKNADSFKGDIYHTAQWPREGVDLTGKRVAIVGCGSSGVQTIPELAKQAKELIAFQRSPVFTFPARNAPMNPKFLAQAKVDYSDIRERQRNSEMGVANYSGPRRPKDSNKPKKPRPSKKILDLTPEQRKQEVKDFGINALSAYVDPYFNPEANEIACDLYRETLKDILDDPQKAEALSPKNYPLHCKRPVIDTEYYSAFNQDNVSIVDLRVNPVEEVTPTGLRTNDAEYEFDVLVYATGFDAMTGTLKKLNIRGRDNQLLADRWKDGPRMYMGLQTVGFPNFFTTTGPGSPSVVSNVLHSIEQHVEWIDTCIDYLLENNIKTIEPTIEAEDAWVIHVDKAAKGSMMTAPTCNSWYLGSNIAGKPQGFMPYIAGTKTYREECDEVVAKGYEGFALTS